MPTMSVLNAELQQKFDNTPRYVCLQLRQAANESVGSVADVLLGVADVIEHLHQDAPRKPDEFSLADMLLVYYGVENYSELLAEIWAEFEAQYLGRRRGAMAEWLRRTGIGKLLDMFRPIDSVLEGFFSQKELIHTLLMAHRCSHDKFCELTAPASTRNDGSLATVGDRLARFIVSRHPPIDIAEELVPSFETAKQVAVRFSQRKAEIRQTLK